MNTPTQDAFDEFSDLTNRFEFEDDSLEYVDGSISGWLKEKGGSQWFAFECHPIVPGLAWHWILVPADRVADAATSLRNAAGHSSKDPWLSIIEDRRNGASICRLAIIRSVRPRLLQQ
jgi:hypothetical protein